ncbi:MAG: DMT family transporter [Methanobacteriota archaeon]
MARDPRIPLAFAGSSAIWGSTFLAIRIGNGSVPPEWAAALRLLLAFLLLAAITFVLRQRFPRGAALRGAALFGFFQFGVNFGLLYWGELVVPSGIAAVFYATIPLSTAVFAAGLGVERFDRWKTIGAIVGFVGVVVLVSGELSVDVPARGLVAILAAATAAAVANVFLKRAPKQDAIPQNAVGCAVGAVVCLGASIAMGEARAIPTEPAGYLPIAYLTVAGSLGAFVLFSWLVHHWSVTSAAFVTLVVPVIALILGAIYGERPSLVGLAGAGLVLVGVAVALAGGPLRTKAGAPLDA